MIIAILSLMGLVSFASDADTYFKNLSVEERNHYISISEVLNPKWNSKIETVDVLRELEDTCKFPYVKGSGQVPVLPVVECDYKKLPDDNPSGGSTPKFNCQFEINGKKKSLKVKYFAGQVDQKELPQAVFVASLSRLMGFYADTYCPAIVKCNGCSADPWKHKSTQDPIPGNVVEFKNAVVEFKVKGEKLTLPRSIEDTRPKELEWKELRYAPAHINKDDRAILLAEREALMLFNNFIHHGDADPHNNRLVCVEWTESPKVECLRVAAYTHDMGDAFRKMDYSYYRRFTPLSSSCVGGLDKGEGLILKPQLSDEARNLFLERFDLVTDSQLSDLLHLAQVHRIPGQKVSLWIETLRKHAQTVRQARCPSIQTGKTVLKF